MGIFHSSHHQSSIHVLLEHAQAQKQQCTWFQKAPFITHMISQFEAGHLKILDAKTGGHPCGATNLFAKSWQAVTHESHIDRAQIQLVENQVLRQKRSV